MVKILTTLILMSLSLALVLGQTFNLTDINMTDAQAGKLTDEEKGRLTNPSPFNASEQVAIEKFQKWEEKHSKLKREFEKQHKI